MKRFLADFLARGVKAAFIGPIVLAFLYMLLEKTGELVSLSVSQVCIGIFSLTALAFIAGGMNAIYQIERLPLMVAILIHGSVLYATYLITYLLNDWLEGGAVPILIFTLIFVVGYFVIWAIIYSIVKKNTEKLNEIWAQKQHGDGLERPM